MYNISQGTDRFKKLESKRKSEEKELEKLKNQISSKINELKADKYTMLGSEIVSVS